MTQPRKLVALSLVIASAGLCGCAGSERHPPVGWSPPDAQAEMGLEEIVGAHPTAFRKKVLGEHMHAPFGVAQFYRERSYAPAWTAGHPEEKLPEELLRAIRAEAREGFDPDDFHEQAIETVVEDVRRRRSLELSTPRRTLAQLDILCTDAFLALANQLQTGRVGLKAQSGEVPQDALPARTDFEPPAHVLARALAEAGAHADNADAVTGVLDGLSPKHPDYQGLVQALARYRSYAASSRGRGRGRAWKLVPPGAKLATGDRDARVPILRARLAAEAYYEDPVTKSWTFDEALARALWAFQERHGLEPSGVLDKATARELNVSARARARQIEANLERWRWLPRDLGARYVAVNVPAYELRAVQAGQEAFRMPVVVGNLYRQTPVFWSRITHVILNPTWTVPVKILIQDILPKARRDPEFLVKNGFHAFEAKRGGREREIALGDIDWNSIDDASDVDFTLREDASAANPLGRIKFYFPNPFSIFLHDTPKHGLFKREARAFSSGCIRLSRPRDLLAFVLKDQADWDDTRLEGLREALDDIGENESIALQNAVPIYLLYQTAWLDADGKTQFRRDIYGQDEALEEQL